MLGLPKSIKLSKGNFFRTESAIAKSNINDSVSNSEFDRLAGSLIECHLMRLPTFSNLVDSEKALIFTSLNISSSPFEDSL